jgi:hypothetical protein
MTPDELFPGRWPQPPQSDKGRHAYTFVAPRQAGDGLELKHAKAGVSVAGLGSTGVLPATPPSYATHDGPKPRQAEAPASIPRQPRRVAQFTNVSATGQIGSRTDLPHCTSRHHFDVARATRLAPAVRPGELTPGSTSA